MTFNLACAYAQFLSRLCIKCNMYLEYIMDGFSEFNGHRMVRRLQRNSVCLFRDIFHPVDL